MDTPEKSNVLKRIMVLNQFTIFLLVCLLLAGLTTVLIFSQKMVERESVNLGGGITTPKDKYEIEKLDAEIKKIRSDTSGSLFWLQVIALFVTVGSAVGGYLIGQSNVTKQRLKFEHRKDIDAAFLAIVQDLSSQEPILRASAAVRLGSILQNFPAEWKVDDTRKKQLVQLGKQVLAAALAIEKDEKVLKTISIALVLDKTIPMTVNSKPVDFSDVRELDLSHANAIDVYWAKADFSYTDFYEAKLSKASFRHSKLNGAQFRSAMLNEAVLANADCEGANFKMADLRGADFSNAKLVKANFEGAKVYNMKTAGADFTNVDDDVAVDASESGDGTKPIMLQEWLKR